jgi:hypothetical protein
MCIYIMHMFIGSPCYSYYVAIQSEFRVSIRVLGICGFGFRMDSVLFCVLVLGFRLHVWVYKDSTRSKSQRCQLPSLLRFLYLLANWLDLSWLSMCTLGSKLSCKLGLHHGSFGLERFGSRTSPSHNN